MTKQLARHGLLPSINSTQRRSIVHKYTNRGSRCLPVTKIFRPKPSTSKCGQTPKASKVRRNDLASPSRTDELTIGWEEENTWHRAVGRGKEPPAAGDHRAVGVGGGMVFREWSTGVG